MKQQVLLVRNGHEDLPCRSIKDVCSILGASYNDARIAFRTGTRCPGTEGTGYIRPLPMGKRLCSGCESIKDESEFYKGKNNKHCRVCHQKRWGGPKVERDAAGRPIGRKTCCGCKEEKAASEFFVRVMGDRQYLDGYCMGCRRMDSNLRLWARKESIAMGMWERTHEIKGATLVQVKGRDAWLAQRKKGVGGSDVASIMGRGFQSVLTVWREKRGLLTAKEKEAQQEFSESERAEFGHRMEDLAATMFCESVVGYRAERVPEGVLVSDSNPWQQASIDRVLIPTVEGGQRAVLEIKNVDASQRKEWSGGLYGPHGEGFAPEKYIDQLLWYLDVTGYPVGYLCAVIGGNRLVVVRVVAADHLGRIAEAKIKAAEFWNCVETGKMPSLSGSEKDLDALTDRDVSEGRAEVEGGLVEQLIFSKRVLKEAEKNYNSLKVAVQEIMGGATESVKTAFFGSQKVAEYRESVRETVDKDLLASKYPQAYAECVSEKPVKAFYITLK